jgi:glutaredoxin
MTNQPGITLYTTPGCSACAAVKRYLEQKELAFEEKDVASDPAYLEEMTQVAGVRMAPVTVIGTQAFYGTFEQQRPRLEAALAAAMT